jgi:hypothetical protein
MGQISPDELLANAKELMLDGRDPETHRDWALVMNFMAHNVHPDTAEPACQLLRVIYRMPLTEDEVSDIVLFHLAKLN